MGNMKFIALALVPVVLTCGPGTGPITATPTMTFTYSPPLGWTWNAAAIGGQSLSAAAAQNRINSDIELAVIQAVQSYGYSTSGVSVNNAVSPDNIVVLPLATSPCTAALEGVQQGGVVTNKCAVAGPSSAAPPFNHTASITVNSPIALYQSNWENIATSVWASLSTNANVKFAGPISVPV